ncbi:Ferric uptake regulator, Fur family [uncultured delta proteobacterium]|uniref:Ferric uptake regulator, Fur family n=1 Tax=uncultured delta proteobacterium TaxID=34034 RepID=A0A212IWY1_9DELT|nr:Ferric uptake regulator, Fur family [uncultured delta proteobacterium]
MEKTTRNTRQRTVILNKLREVTSHPTADEIFSMTREMLPRISLGTVYRNLELLARQGDILCIESGGAQKRFDGNMMPHHHARCSECGKIVDVEAVLPLPDVGTVQVEGFTLTSAEILFEGVCDSCKM